MSAWRAVGSGIWVTDYRWRGNVIHTSAIDLGDGGLLILSPGVDVPATDFQALDALGTVQALVCPGAFHHMGLPAWSERYPGAGLYGPTSAIAHVAGQHPGLKALQPPAALRPLLSAEFELDEVAGCKHPDLFLAVRRPDGVTWFTNEIVSNNATYPSSLVFGLAFRLTGNHPGLNVNSLAAMLIGAKKSEVRAYLEGKLASTPPTRLVPTHGDVLDDPALADRLGAVLARRF